MEDRIIAAFDRWLAAGNEVSAAERVRLWTSFRCGWMAAHDDAPKPSPDSARMYPDIEESRRNNAVVNAVLRAGGTLEDCVGALVRREQEFIQRIIELETIAPRRIKVGNQTYIWRCPDGMIPENVL